MKHIVPWALLAVACGASCTLDLSGISGGTTGGSSAAATSSSATTGGGGASSTTTGSMAMSSASSASASSASSAASSSSTGGGPVWAHRRTLDLDLGTNGEVDDFAVLVLLDKTRIDYGATRDKGEDLRFTDLNDKPLDHEIERWDESFNSLVWVRVPKISRNGNNHTSIQMYYGNAAADDGQNAHGLWGGSYAGVWHLHQADDALADSSGNTAVAVNHGSTSMPAFLGYGRNFVAGSQQYIDTLNDKQVTRFTVEAWVKGNHDAYSGSGPNGPLMREKNYQIVWDHASPFTAGASLNTEDSNASGQNWKTADFGGLDGGTWFYLAATFSGDALRSYRDGTKQDEKNFNLTDPQAEDRTAKIGRHAFNTGTANFFDGMIDEVRISTVARTDLWIQTQNKSMRNDGFVGFGAEQTGSYALP